MVATVEQAGINTTDDYTELHWKIDQIGRTLLDIQAMRIQIFNRQFAATGGEGTIPELDHALQGMEQLEKDTDRSLTKLMRQHFMRTWIERECKGVGLPVVGRLMGIIGPLDKFATVSKLWKYCGLAVAPDGSTQKRVKGQKINFTPMARVICHRIGESIVKVGKGGKYRGLYDYKKAEYFNRERLGESQCPMGLLHMDKGKNILQCVKTDENGAETSGHLHNAAMRYAVKCFLRDFWEEWYKRRQAMGYHAHYSDALIEAVDAVQPMHHLPEATPGMVPISILPEIPAEFQLDE